MSIRTLIFANSAAPTEKANVVWNRGITGTGIKVAVVEDGGIAFANPYLTDGSYFNSANPNIQSHETAIAGIIESMHSTHTKELHMVLQLFQVQMRRH